MSPLSCAALAVALASPEPRETAPAPEPLPWRGTGLLIAGSVAGLAGLGLGIGTTRQVAAIEHCPGCRGDPSFALPFTSIALNTAAFTLIAAGAGLRGRDDRLRFTDPGPPQTALRLGALIVGGGGVLIAGALAWRLLDAQRSAGTSWAASQAAMSMIIVGTGLIVYGAAHRRSRIVPLVNRHHAGLALIRAF